MLPKWSQSTNRIKYAAQISQRSKYESRDNRNVIKGFGINDIPAQRQKGLLLIYLLDPQQALSAAEHQDDALPVVAFGISFPGSRSGVTVEYKVNNVLWEQEYGAAE